MQKWCVVTLGVLRQVHSLFQKQVLTECDLVLPLSNSRKFSIIKLLNPELNPICYLLALLGAHYFLHVSGIRVKLLTLRRLMSYIYMEHPFLMFLDHRQRRSTVGRTPLDEWSALAETSTWQHTTLTTDKYPCPRWDSNPRSQQASGRAL